MKKYDCNKTLDFSHECSRMCHSVYACEECPLHTRCADLSDITAEHIDIVQKWSDEHSEMPKLTREERDFLDCFYDNQGMAIQRVFKDRLYVRQRSQVYIDFMQAYIDSIMIDPNLFPFIEEGEEWDFNKLFELEVIE